MFRKNNFLGVWVRSRLGERSDRVKLPVAGRAIPTIQSTEQFGYRQGVYSRTN
ncbi:hypothetical protein H6F74_23080 [Trichocoleus sp. FACHB-90]|uniref:hypothetical protein n=1 Tax=Cyanophyceae TaxID=3028117 RepID=UPI00168A3A74|nr:hypothetical protein [Trichocoleus sp. FACHB-90]MBD1929105.1 hypothetical protein [Trichocoleus sp. FACHB-90]